MSFGLISSRADRRLLPEGRLAGPMPWVIAIMMFLTALAAATGLGLGAAARTIGNDLSGKLTVQIVEANPDIRDAQAQAVERVLRGQADVTALRRVGEAEMAALLEPWLGEAGLLGEDLPVPALIDVSLRDGDDKRVEAVEQAVRKVAPTARIDRHARWLEPIIALIGSLQWLAAALVGLMAAATASIVVLSARAALNTHRETIDVLHLMGATDLQITHLFQRRIALDALFGGLVGLIAAYAVILLLGDRVQAMGSDMLGAVSLSGIDRALILALPFAGALLATFAARVTVIKSLRKML
ncbi:cell division protein FtsX [Sphingomonas sp. C3-2]|uniref:cell division protein FtsX n=1 Tax=Sphingomonas sp. C3-2 TaxID=3062169 RepID=UPI00294B3B47|nr:FtsX-like permease family protein [Sphingomonas sp. C3-2]WOK35198.1 cell division protein [Sphingomonas sp. C3-2]